MAERTYTRRELRDARRTRHNRHVSIAVFMHSRPGRRERIRVFDGTGITREPDGPDMVLKDNLGTEIFRVPRVRVIDVIRNVTIWPSLVALFGADMNLLPRRRP
jgi:hypothetical protein